jgi:type II secretory ATPase GspE/PulE/Tfp pilus assembly ATPase PilB-like protein
MGRTEHARQRVYSKLISVEDPVEYDLPGVNQIQVNTSIGLDFPRVLRSVLRHDPELDRISVPPR